MRFEWDPRKAASNIRSGIRAEYDLRSMAGGVRGKHLKAFREGTNIAVLDDDVASAFPTDDSVNRALRTIMAAAREMPRVPSAGHRSPRAKPPKPRR
jgi:hypothetical protein